MKTIKLDIAYDYFGGVYRTAFLANPPSKSFLKQARIALTEQLSERIEDPICRARLADDFDVVLDWSLLAKNPKERRLLPLKLEPKSDACVLLSFGMVWDYQQPGREGFPAPWLDYPDGELLFGIVAAPDEIRRMNAEIPSAVSPIIRKEESGLPYDYLIKTHDGTVQILFRDAVTEPKEKIVAEILNRFFTKYNETHEDKIHEIGSPKKQGDKRVVFNADFGGAPIDAVNQMIRSFEAVEGIKKITFQ